MNGSASSRPVHAFGFDQLAHAPLILDGYYTGGRQGHRGDDPIQALTGTGNADGFRIRNNNAKTAKAYGVLYSSGHDPNWPDYLDTASGTYTYHGDEKVPGRDLHDTPRGGNQFLRDAWTQLAAGPTGRRQIPPLFLFVKAGSGSDVIFRGLLVPGGAMMSPDEQLVPVWRMSGGLRYQNYRAIFTVLDINLVERAWLADLMCGDPTSRAAPEAWMHWVETGVARALKADRPLAYRTKAEQLPTADADIAIIKTMREYFRGAEHAFERCAADIFQMLSPAATISNITRAVVDKGRDAFGYYSIGPESDPIRLDWSLEAKCYSLSSPVTTRHTGRLLLRLRHRQFGVIVTTSYVDRQAYQEIRDDRHPLIIITAVDIVRVLRRRGLGTSEQVLDWLTFEYEAIPGS